LSGYLPKLAVTAYGDMEHELRATIEDWQPQAGLFETAINLHPVQRL
jgi:hypothetical protein